MGRIFMVLALGLFFLQGCAMSGANAAKEPCRTQLYGTQWRLAVYDNDEIAMKTPPTLRFDEKGGRIGGYSGCNSYFGAVTLTDTEIRFPKALGSTRKFCMGKAGEMERRLFSFFTGTKWWQFDAEGRLVIFDDEHRLIFVRD
ncbi:META domain-containing protein [Hydrogenimonas sp.]